MKIPRAPHIITLAILFFVATFGLLVLFNDSVQEQGLATRELIRAQSKNKELISRLSEEKKLRNQTLLENLALRGTLFSQQMHFAGISHELIQTTKSLEVSLGEKIFWQEMLYLSEEKRCALENRLNTLGDDLDSAQQNLIALQKDTVALLEMDWPSDPKGLPLRILSCQRHSGGQTDPAALLWVYNFWNRRIYPVRDYSGKFDRGMTVLSWDNPTGRSTQRQATFEEVQERFAYEEPTKAP